MPLRVAASRFADGARAAWRPAAIALFWTLGLGLVLGRVPLPGGDSFGFNSTARNLVALLAAGALLGAPGAHLRAGHLGAPLLVYLAACTASVVASGGAWGELRTFATACGLFFVARALADLPGGASMLLHWLGCVAVGIVAREVAHDPGLLLLDEAKRTALATDNANTLGYAFAVLVPPFLAAAHRHRAAIGYASAALVGALLTFSRAAWAGVLLGLIVLALAPRRGGRTGLRSPFAAAAGLALAAALALVSQGRAAADAERVRIAATSLSLFCENWPTGVGFGSGNLARVFPARHIELFGSGAFLFHSHDLYLDILTGTGVAGAIAAAWLLVRLAWPALRAARAARPIEQRARAASVLAFLAVGLLDTPVYHGRLAYILVVLWALFEAAPWAAPGRPRAVPCYEGSRPPAGAATASARGVR